MYIYIYIYIYQLQSVATHVTTSDIFVMKLQHVQHICRRISARPAQPASSSASSGTPIGLLMTLNPTPAGTISLSGLKLLGPVALSC